MSKCPACSSENNYCCVCGALLPSGVVADADGGTYKVARESILWEDTPADILSKLLRLMRIRTEYRITNEKISIIRSFFLKGGDTIHLDAVCEHSYDQRVLQAIRRLGNVTVSSSAQTIILRNVKHPEAVDAIIQDALNLRRRSEG